MAHSEGNQSLVGETMGETTLSPLRLRTKERIPFAVDSRANVTEQEEASSVVLHQQQQQEPSMSNLVHGAEAVPAPEVASTPTGNAAKAATPEAAAPCKTTPCTQSFSSSDVVVVGPSHSPHDAAPVSRLPLLVAVALFTVLHATTDTLPHQVLPLFGFGVAVATATGYAIRIMSGGVRVESASLRSCSSKASTAAQELLGLRLATYVWCWTLGGSPIGAGVRALFVVSVLSFVVLPVVAAFSSSITLVLVCFCIILAWKSARIQK